MATYTQDLILTTLPFGITKQTTNAGTDTYLNFSVVVSMRLGSDQSSAQLSNYSDWTSPGRTWPDTIAAIQGSMRLHLKNLSGAPSLPVTLRAASPQPDAARFAAAFPGPTPVTPYSFKGADHHKIRSAPVGQIVDALQQVYGQFGYKSPRTFPKYTDLVQVSAFGPMGFQQDNPPRSVGSGEIGGKGAQRKIDLNKALDDVLNAHKAIPEDLTSIAAGTGIKGAVRSMAFLQLQRFLQRDLPKISPTLTGRPPVPQFDFHQRVAGLHSQPTLLRVLGLVLDLQVGPVDPGLVHAWETTPTDTLIYVTVNKNLFLDAATTTVTSPRTHAHLARGIFKALPKDPADTDHALRMLKVGDTTRCEVIQVDHDSAGIKAIQFADNVTRSHDATGKVSSVSPDNYALPALRTGGFAVARRDRASLMVAALQRQTDLQNGFFGAANTPTLYEEDLIRGYRFDVLDVKDGVWRSLMWRHGTITINGASSLPNVLEEDTVVPAPTTAKKTQSLSADLYLQQTLTKWDGWSLAVPRLGTPATGVGRPIDDADPTPFNITTDWHVPASNATPDVAEASTGNQFRLPRLRFGRAYRLRARAVDLAGKSLLPDQAPKTGNLFISRSLQHLRFEPLPAPRAVLVDGDTWTPPLPAAQILSLRPGDSEEVIVIRSESATVDSKGDIDNGTTLRLLLPPQSSVTMAEQHEAFDGTTQGLPMENLTAVWQNIADRDGTSIEAVANLLDGDHANSTSNPWLFPNFMSIAYLPDVPVHAALVRHLPANAFKATTATLPFDTAGNGWPNLEAVRIRLSRGATNWTTNVVPDSTDSTRTTELDVTLPKGVMVTTLVNAAIAPDTVNIMALWAWIQNYAKAHNLNTSDVLNSIKAGEHWMFTPWRQVTFVHAVRTPLKNPVLELQPKKSLIGQTYASFLGTKDNPKGGTILFSRKSTARVDVNADWTMMIDTGSNLHPDQPMEFKAHAFSIEPTRTGLGWSKDSNGNAIEILDAENLNTKHEFADTKYRAVTYKGTATSYYPEYFREHFELKVSSSPATIADLKAGITPGVAFEGSTVRITMSWTENGVPKTRTLTQAPDGTDPLIDPPVPGDYVVVEDPDLNGPDPNSATNGTVRLLFNANVNDTGKTNISFDFSYVGPTIHTVSNPATDNTHLMHILNTARPKAPKVLYVIPIYKRTLGQTSITRTGGALRVYLDRPWWSSGDEERLGVVCWHQTAISGKRAPDALAPYVTQWGYDPVFKSSTSLPKQPTPSCFPLATKRSSNGSLTIDESSTKVDVAGHDVGFDSDRGLWYCDIQVTDPNGKSLTTYTPFIRFALARYQPNSIANAHLSRVVLVDYAQLAPDRHVTIVGDRLTRQATITGRAARATSSSTKSNKIVLFVEERDTRVPDDELGWIPAQGVLNTYVMGATARSSSDFVTWTQEVALPNDTNAIRLTFEEYERIADGDGAGRLAWTESIVVRSLPQ